VTALLGLRPGIIFQVVCVLLSHVSQSVTVGPSKAVS